jgi:hypothetical protein
MFAPASMKRTRNIAIAVVLTVWFGVTGCVHVAPWERGNLAKPQMDIDPNPLQTEIQSHNYSSREAAPSHKSSAGGGGCGCY